MRQRNRDKAIILAFNCSQERKTIMFQNASPELIITIVTIIASIAGIVLGTAVPALAEGKAAQKALEGMARQPDAASDLRTTLLISMALLESTAIYVLLIILIIIFANPLLDRFFLP
jgi:F-type H+-transporting ATPase subunit c